MPDGKVEYEVRADTSKLDGDLQNATRKIETESKNWENAGKGAAGSIELSMDALIKKAEQLGIAFGKFVVQFIEQGIDMAASLKEIDGMVDMTFGTSGAAKIDKWAKASVAQYGLTEAAAKKYAASLGVLMKASGATGDEAAEMSQQLTGFAVDLASLMNIDTDTMVNAIRSAMNGKGTSLKNLIGLDLGASAMKEYAVSKGYKDFSSLTTAQQAQLRYEALMNYGAENSVSGGFARSKGSVQNSEARVNASVQNFQTEVGKTFLPLKEQSMQFWADVLEWLTGVPPAVMGSLEDLNKWNEEAKKEANESRSQLDQIALKYGRQIIDADMEGTEYDPAFFNSFGESLYTQLLAMRQGAGGKQREKIDAALIEMQPFIDEITQSDQAVQSFQKQIEFLENLPAEEAGASAEDVGQSVADGLNAKLPEVRAAVDSYIAELNRLNNVQTGGGVKILMPLATGMDYVPHDGFPATLHEGESVLTAEEAKVWRNFKYGGISKGNTVNYDALGVTMRENVKAGGNVFLDGEIVGRVISAMQGESYRAMERSGYQA